MTDNNDNSPPSHSPEEGASSENVLQASSPQSPDQLLRDDGQTSRQALAIKIALIAGILLAFGFGYWKLPPLSEFNENCDGDISSCAPDAKDTLSDDPSQRQSMPDFILTDANGDTKKFSSYKNKVVILSFWASWCTPCLVELPVFSTLKKKYETQGFEVITVNVDEGDEGKAFSQDFWTKSQFNFPKYFDTTKELAQQFDVEMLPSNFVFDRQGRMVFSSFGSNDWLSDQSIESLEALLNENEDSN